MSGRLFGQGVNLYVGTATFGLEEYEVKSGLMICLTVKQVDRPI